MKNQYVFGVDVGGTSVKLGLFAVSGALLDKWEIATDLRAEGGNILADIAKSIRAKMVEKNLETANVLGVGMGVPGAVDEKGVINKAINLGWGVFAVEAELQQILGLRVRAGNDANVAALGEFWQGSGAEVDSLVMVTLGTGVGGGVIIDGKIMVGKNGAAGELGHICVNVDEETYCSCGNKGCVEQYASATGIVNTVEKEVKNGEKTRLSGDEITAKNIIQAAKEGDAVSLFAVEKMGKALGIALANCAAVCDPEIFVIGGGVSAGGAIIVDTIAKYYQQYAFHASKDTKFKIATLGNDAGIYGAAKLIVQ